MLRQNELREFEKLKFEISYDYLNRDHNSKDSHTIIICVLLNDNILNHQ